MVEGNSTINKIILKHTTSPAIVKVKHIRYFSKVEVIGIVLFDGTNNIEVLLDKACYTKLNPKLEIRDFTAHKSNMDIFDFNNGLDIGSVIIIKEYGIKTVKRSEMSREDYFVLKDFIHIGTSNKETEKEHGYSNYATVLPYWHDLPRFGIYGFDKGESSRPILSDNYEQEEDEHSTDQYFKVNPIKENKPANQYICIKNLNENIQGWIVNAEVIHKGKITEFINRNTSQKGKWLRIKIKDQTCSIEVVAFNNHCKLIDILQEGQVFDILNATVKLASSKVVKNFAESCYELHVNSTTTVALKTEKRQFSETELWESSEPKKIKIECLRDNVTDGLEINLYKIRSNKAKSIVSVIGIITKIDELKYQQLKNNNSIELRNILIADEYDEIKVALWGKQAKDFNFEEGSVLIFRDAEISDYGGISLSVLRTTKYFKAETNLPKAEILTAWFNKIKNKT